MIKLPRLLDASGNEVRRIRPINLSINEKIVPLSTASMTILKEDLIPDRSYVELFTINGSAGVYRARTPEVGYGADSLSIGLEHAVCEVGDWLVRNAGEQEQKTLANAISHFFSYYGGSKWQLGTVSATGNVIVQDNYQNILNAINGAIAQIPSAMMTFNFSTSPWTINVTTRETTVSAEGRLSRNVESAKVKKDDTKLCTRVWLKGLGTDGAYGKMDADTIGTYGVIETSLNSGDYTQAQAQTVAGNYLAKHKRPTISVTISANDLSSITGLSQDRFRIGKRFRLAIPDEGVTVEENITAIQWSNIYTKKGNCKITLAEESESTVTFLQQTTSNVNGAYGGISNLSNTVGEQQADLSLIWRKTGISALGEEETLMTKITANANGIATEVSRATASEGTLSSRITQTAEAITTEVSRATTAEGTLSSRITQTAEAITSEVSRATAAEGTLSSRITQTAEAITSEVTRATASEGTLSSRITQTATDITSEVTRATSAEGTLSSRITQTSTDITTLVTKTGINSLGNNETLYSKISQQASQIALVVTQESGQDVINTANIILGVNAQTGSYVKIKADAVDIEGIVSATEARIDKLITGDTTATELKGRWIVAETLHVQQDFFFGPDSAPMHIGPINVTISGTSYTFLGVVTP